MKYATFITATHLKRLVLISAVSLAGTVLIFSAQASTGSISLESDEGSIADGAMILQDASASGGSAVQFGSSANIVVLNPAHIGDTTDLVNSMRGFHRWRNQTGASTIPQPAPYPVDGYNRYWWSDLETSKGVYDFSRITSAINSFTDPSLNGGIQGRQFGFRIRAMSDGSDGSLRAPAYLQSEGCTTYYATKNVYVPNWNQTCFQDRMDALYAALNTALQPYKNRINFIDIGMYGQWGEWSLYQYPDQYRATDATMNIMIDQHVEHFGWAQLLMLVTTHTPTAEHAMAMQPGTTSGLAYPIGLRADCYDCPGFLGAQDKLGTGRPESLRTRWKTAPFVVERGTGDGQTALDAVKNYHVSSIGNDIKIENQTTAQFDLYRQAGLAAGYRLSIPEARLYKHASQPAISIDWKNTGSAPPYRPWDVSVWLEAAGNTVATATADLPIVQLLPGDTVTQKLTLQAGSPLPGGTYTVKIKITDPAGYLQPMQLPLSSGSSQSGYTIGTVTL